MVNKAIKKILKKRHFWRTVGFDELSEIYASQFLRSLGMSIIGIFVPIYLFKIGYSVQSIFGLFVMWVAFKPIVILFIAKTIARVGPKHGIALGTIFTIVYLSALLSIQEMNWPIILISFLGSLAYSMFGISFEVDFSKIKHTEHGGKEIGYLQIFERIGAIAGPIIGGLLATIFDPRYTIAAAIIVLCGSLIPIFMTAEPTATHQHIQLKGFPFRRHKRDFLSSMAFGVENTVSIVVWPLFIAITIFTTKTFAELGLLSAISTAAALVAVIIIGKTIDKRHGGRLLNIGTSINAVIHLLRPFASNVLQVFAINIINEPVTAAYRMPYVKGRYDASDSVPGYRIVYFALCDLSFASGNSLLWLFLYTACFYLDPITVMKLSFVIGAIASLGIMSQRFIALKDTK
jgi:MFS family permease